MKKLRRKVINLATALALQEENGQDYTGSISSALDEACYRLNINRKDFLSVCAKLEKEGKNKMDKVKNTFKFRKGQRVKIRVKIARKSKIIKGKVLFDNDYILTIKGPKYNETINKIDLFTEDAILL